MFACMECDARFRSFRDAEAASRNGCPKCGGTDIDEADYEAELNFDHEPDYGGAFDGFSVSSDADPGL